MKTSDVLIIGAVALGAIYLMKKQTETPAAGGGGTIITTGTMPDLSWLANLFAGQVAGNILPDFSDLIENITKKGEGVATGIVEIGEGVTGAITRTGENWLDKIAKEFEYRLRTLTEAGDRKPVGLPDTTDKEKADIPPLDTDSQDLWDRIRGKTGLYGGALAGIGSAVVTRGAPFALSKTLTSVAGHIAPRLAAKVPFAVATKAIPFVGWAYLAADIGATVYELVSGKNIAGGWLGWGELFRPEQKSEVSVDKVLAYQTVGAGYSTESRPKGFPSTQETPFLLESMMKMVGGGAGGGLGLAPKPTEQKAESATSVKKYNWIPQMTAEQRKAARQAGVVIEQLYVPGALGQGEVAP